jgi:hypothetical protein
LTSLVLLKNEESAQVVAVNYVRTQKGMIVFAWVNQAMPATRKETLSLTSVRPEVIMKLESKYFASIALKEAGNKPVR